MWVEAQLSLNGLLQKEMEEKSQKPIKDRLVVFQMLGTFYVKYVQIFRNLEAAYDQIVHPQKRLIIRQVLDGVMGRILELKNEMVDLEYSEFHYFDDILQDLKLIPDSIDIPIPRYFIKEKLKVLKERERILAQILLDAGLYDDEPVENHLEPRRGRARKRVKVMVLDEAVRLIQIAERARQGRLRATFMKQIYLEEKRERQAKLQTGKIPNLDASATRIQKVASLPQARLNDATGATRLPNPITEPRGCSPTLPVLGTCRRSRQLCMACLNQGRLTCKSGVGPVARHGSTY
uniref:Dynein regulatory complex protein 11 n=1 Tax=Sphaerodactylus townsendi TaxID=933632 RepID=A0ACB8GEA3_9SAUR